jgi:site-specific DNA-methyltransferase (adenine-specific)
MSVVVAPYQAYKNLSPATERALRASVKRFGILVPMVKDQHGNVLDGHQRARLASILGVECPSVTRQVADEDEAREIARTLNEDRRSMPKEQRLPVVQALREEGHSIRAIAGAVGVDVHTVHDDLSGVGTPTPAATHGLDGKSYPARRTKTTTPHEPATPVKHDRSRAAVAARHERIRGLAAEGHTAAQIADLVGLAPEGVKMAAKRDGINLAADTVMHHTRQPKVEHILSRTVDNLRAEAASLSLLPENYSVEPVQAREWAQSLYESRTAITRLLNRLRSMGNE